MWSLLPYKKLRDRKNSVSTFKSRSVILFLYSPLNNLVSPRLNLSSPSVNLNTVFSFAESSFLQCQVLSFSGRHDRECPFLLIHLWWMLRNNEKTGTQINFLITHSSGVRIEGPWDDWVIVNSSSGFEVFALDPSF